MVYNETLPLSVPITTIGDIFNDGQPGDVTIGSTDGGIVTIFSNGNIVDLNGSLNINDSVSFNFENVIAGTTDYSINDTHYLVDISTTDITNVILPVASANNGRRLIISNGLSNHEIFVKISPGSGDLIDDLSAVSLPLLNQRLSLISSGTNKWFIV